MDIIQELQEIKARVDGLLSELSRANGTSPDRAPGSGEIVVPTSLPPYRNDAILAVLEANYDLMRPSRPLGAMRNKEILATLNQAGRDDRPTDVDFYLSNLYLKKRVERLETGLYRAIRHP